MENLGLLFLFVVDGNAEFKKFRPGQGVESRENLK